MPTGMPWKCVEYSYYTEGPVPWPFNHHTSIKLSHPMMTEVGDIPPVTRVHVIKHMYIHPKYHSGHTILDE